MLIPCRLALEDFVEVDFRLEWRHVRLDGVAPGATNAEVVGIIAAAASNRLEMVDDNLIFCKSAHAPLAHEPIIVP
tara:strand:+ start:139 stop:366 length:228 start_codon:yes stop_codon:yes gene_type:complete